VNKFFIKNGLLLYYKIRFSIAIDFFTETFVIDYFYIIFIAI